MPTQTVNLTLQEDITRVSLQALIACSTVIPKRTYRITDAIGPTAEIILVKGLTVNTITGYAINETTNEWGTYDIGSDVFTVQGTVGDFIPYDKANQTTFITGGRFDVDPIGSTGFTMDDGAGVVTDFNFENGNVQVHIASATADTVVDIADGIVQITVDGLAGKTSDVVVDSGNVTISHTDGGSTYTVEVADDGISLNTPFVAGGGDPTGMKLLGQDATGVVEFEDEVAPDSISTELTVNSHGFAVGDWLYLNGGTWTKAIATSEAASNVLGVVSEVVDTNNFVLTNVGYVSTLSGLGASGLVFYLSPTTAGAMTTTKPTTVGQVIRKLFISQTNNAGWVLQEHTDKVQRLVRLSGSNFTTTSATESVVTGLTIAVEANKIYKGRVVISFGCSNTGGVRFGFNFPAAATLNAGISANTSGSTAQQQQTTGFVSGTAFGANFNTQNSQNGYAVIDFVLVTGANAGNVELITRSGTAGQTSTIYINLTNMSLEEMD